ncbi:MAG: polysaccharide biosynthesis tyrosine autokinase [Cyanobium sp. PLM2.Bin73]|nr:MAG: polysaccharide biosynthesis tyrosine autokinase [Cyanobium sp. PLM2.Bin73]
MAIDVDRPTMPPQNSGLQPSGVPAQAGEAAMATPNGLVMPAMGQQEDGGGFDIKGLGRMLRRRRKPFLIGLILITGLQVARTLHERATSPVYEGEFTLMITDPINDRPGNEAGQQLGGAFESLARNTASIDVPTLLRVLQSQSVIGPVYEQLLAEGVEESDLPQLSVEMVRADDSARGVTTMANGILRVAGRGSDPQLLGRGLNLTEQAFLNWSTRQRQERLRDGLEFLAEQEPRLRATTDDLQRNLQRFREANTLVEPTAEAQALLNQIEQLDGQLKAQEGEQLRLQELRADVSSGRLSARDFRIAGAEGPRGIPVGGVGSTATGGGEVSANLPNQALLDELQRLEQEIAQAEANFQPNAPVLVSLKASRDKLLPQLRRGELDVVDAALRQNANAMVTTRAQIGRIANQFRQQPELLRQFEGLQQQLQIADGNLESYLRTREQFQLEVAQQSTPWKVISPTEVGNIPVEPSLRAGLTQGLLFGLVGGFALALLRERFDHVFHSPQEVGQELNLPLLGHIPYVEFFDGVRRDKRFLLSELDQPREIKASNQHFTYKESLRNLYTNLRFLSTNKPMRSVGITSSLPSEGKSLLIVLLAKTLSEMGQRVLLVDADLRKPHIHSRLGLDNGNGLSNLLTDEAADWRDVVQPVPNYPGWTVLSAGQLPPDPPRLLASERMAQIVQDLATSGGFDLILYDTPAAQGLADAALIAQHLEGMVLVVSLDHVNRDLPARSLERIRASGAPLLGVVTNARRRSSEQDLEYAPYGIGTVYGHYTGLDDDDADTDGRTSGSKRRLKRLGTQVTTWLDR